MEKIWEELYQAAKTVQNPREISEKIDARGVAAAIESRGSLWRLQQLIAKSNQKDRSLVIQELRKLPGCRLQNGLY